MKPIPLLHEVLLSVLSLTISSAAQASTTKRGIAYLGTSNQKDYNIFTSKSSPLDWYYNWSPYPIDSNGFPNMEFAPLLGPSNLQSDIQQLSNLPSNSRHVLTFNEPDGSVSSGGSATSPSDAAKLYVQNINPLSKSVGGKYLLSHPSTTGTLSGINWLRQFNASCYALNPHGGCYHDFIATHFYGDFPALASFLGTLNEYFNTNTSSNLPIWITEIALPQQDATATEIMMNTTLPYLDNLDYVEKYAWFGIFRQQNANEWTGDGVSLLDNQGRLTPLGARYLTFGNSTTYKAGESASSGGPPNNAASQGSAMSLLGIIVAVSALVYSRL